MSAAALDIVGIRPELRDHEGPWTEREYLDLRSRHRWPRAELLDGQLLVTPAASNLHDNVVGRFWLKLLTAAPRGELGVFMTANLRINSKRYFIPDLIVTIGADGDVVFNDPASVVLAAEVMSPSTHVEDRVVKPNVYATAGIPWYVRIELEGSHPPEVIAYHLKGDTYAEHTRAHAGQEFRLAEPIEVSFDPAELAEFWL